MALLHFTSGTTGMPKGAVHVHDAAVMHYVTGKYALDLHPEDVFWCTADPGWVTGMSYGIIAPLLHGVTNFVDEGDFDAERWYGILERERISVWYTAPTAVRMLMRAPIEPRARFDLRRLRFVASVGEPLNPSAVVWGQQALGLPIHDNWWQTETGGIMIANYAAMEIRPGSMGRPIPGIEAAVVRRSDDADSVEVVSEPNEEGELALRPGWPSMFRGYLHEDERYRKCFAGGWYLTGDLAQRDADGYYHVRRARRRHHQDRGAHGRPVRGGERVDGAPGRGGSRRHRKAGPDDRRDRQSIRRAQVRASSRAKSCVWN